MSKHFNAGRRHENSRLRQAVRQALRDFDGRLTTADAAQVAYRHIFDPDELDRIRPNPERFEAELERPTTRPSTSATNVARPVVGPSRDERNLGELYAIYVDPDVWSEGAGRALLERAEERHADGYEEATLWVLTENPRARRFYEQAGWAADGTEKTEEWLGVEASETRYRKSFKSSRSRS